MGSMRSSLYRPSLFRIVLVQKNIADDLELPLDMIEDKKNIGKNEERLGNVQLVRVLVGDLLKEPHRVIAKIPDRSAFGSGTSNRMP